jgi:heme o synthase
MLMHPSVLSPDSMQPAHFCIASAERGWDFLRLTKPRLGLLVLFATAVGFCMASRGALDWQKLAFVLFGTALVSGGAAVLNQVLEMRWDRLMARTCDRPLPSGRIARSEAFALGVGMLLVGLACLALQTTMLALCAAGLALVVYLAAYTPMKRRSSACVLVGAIAGALPPVIGWAAVDGSLRWETGMLFGVLFAWQIPHLTAIAWMHRDDYANAGFAFLPVEASGQSTALQALTFSGVLTVATLLPVVIGATGAGYLVGTLLLDALLLTNAALFLWKRNRESARRLFVVSIVYLSAFLTLMLLAWQ